MTSTTQAVEMISEQESSVLLVMLYFNLFNYPLTEKEIARFSRSADIEQPLLSNAIDALVHRGLVFKTGEYYALSNDMSLSAYRNKGMEMAEKLMKKANVYGRLIHAFPFVRSVCISGSLSKGCVDESGDVDYFIVTEPQRLWVARTLLIVFKKLFLFNRHKYFCVNYFVDTNHLEIQDKNIFTATELLTLTPMSGHNIFEKLISENNWTSAFLPAYQVKVRQEKENKDGILKRTTEWILKGYLGNWLDTVFMELTIRRWRKKFSNFNEEELDSAMRSRKYVSKHHPQNFQKRVLSKFEESIRQFEEKNKVTLHG